MCSLDQAFKLCSCGPVSETDLMNSGKPYWILYRRDRSINTITMGELIYPYDDDPLKEEENKKAILLRLTESGVFDFNPDLKKGDLLLLHFGKTKKGCKELRYTFRFQAKGWKFSDTDIFEISNQYSLKAAGKILT